MICDLEERGRQDVPTAAQEKIINRKSKIIN